MAISGQQINVGTTPTVLVKGNGHLDDPVPAIIRNHDPSVSVFLGGPGVTTATGFELIAAQAISVALFSSDVLYGIATGTVRVDVLLGRQ